MQEKGELQRPQEETASETGDEPGILGSPGEGQGETQASLPELLQHRLTEGKFHEEFEQLPDEEQHQLLGRLADFLALQQTRRQRTSSQNQPAPEQLLAALCCEGRIDLTRAQTMPLPTNARRILEYYERNITVSGDQAIAHLCLSARTFHALRRSGIHTIQQLRSFVDQENSGVSRPSLPHAQGVGPKGLTEIRAALETRRLVNRTP